jgi:hypothetical protein
VRYLIVGSMYENFPMMELDNGITTCLFGCMDIGSLLTAFDWLGRCICWITDGR